MTEREGGSGTSPLRVDGAEDSGPSGRGVERLTLVDTYADEYGIVRESSGVFTVRYLDRDPDTATIAPSPYTVGGCPQFTTEAEAWAYACGYSVGARENM